MTASRPVDDAAEHPMLLCAGTDPAVAARLADVAGSLLAGRPAVVMATWHAPPMSGLETVLDALYDADRELRAAARDAAAAAAEAAIDVLRERGITVSRRLSPEEMAPWNVALEVAEEVGASIVVAGTNEAAGARPGALGREARALAHRSGVALLLVPPEAEPPSNRAPAVFAYDGSAPAAHALERATALLTPRPAIVTMAWQTTSYAVGVALLALPAGVAQSGADRLDEAARNQAATTAVEAGARLTSAGWGCETTAVEARDSVATALVDFADERDAGVIVTGTRGRSRVAAALLGSTAEALARHAGRPVCSCRRNRRGTPVDAPGWMRTSDPRNRRGAIEVQLGSFAGAVLMIGPTHGGRVLTVVLNPDPSTTAPGKSVLHGARTLRRSAATSVTATSAASGTHAAGRDRQRRARPAHRLR